MTMWEARCHTATHTMAYTALHQQRVLTSGLTANRHPTPLKWVITIKFSLYVSSYIVAIKGERYVSVLSVPERRVCE